MLYLVRHCQSAGQQAEAPLTPLGFEQAEQLVDRFRQLGVARIVSSPYRRAVQSVEPLANDLGLTLETDERLIERVLSTEWLDDWREGLRAAWDDFDLTLPGGESSRQATSRGMAAILDVVDDPRQPAVVATHGNLLALILHAIDGRPGFTTWQQLTNPDIFQVTFEPSAATTPDRWTVIRIV